MKITATIDRERNLIRLECPEMEGFGYTQVNNLGEADESVREHLRYLHHPDYQSVPLIIQH